MMYAGKLDIKKESIPKTVVCFERTIDLGGGCELTFEDLRNYGLTENGDFQIFCEEDGCHYELYITNYRLETPEEVAVRVEKAEAYNKRYEEYHKNRKT